MDVVVYAALFQELFFLMSDEGNEKSGFNCQTSGLWVFSHLLDLSSIWFSLCISKICLELVTVHVLYMCPVGYVNHLHWSRTL